MIRFTLLARALILGVVATSFGGCGSTGGDWKNNVTGDYGEQQLASAAFTNGVSPLEARAAAGEKIDMAGPCLARLRSVEANVGGWDDAGKIALETGLPILGNQFGLNKSLFKGADHALGGIGKAGTNVWERSDHAQVQEALIAAGDAAWKSPQGYFVVPESIGQARIGAYLTTDAGQLKCWGLVLDDSKGASAGAVPQLLGSKLIAVAGPVTMPTGAAPSAAAAVPVASTQGQPAYIDLGNGKALAWIDGKYVEVPAKPPGS